MVRSTPRLKLFSPKRKTPTNTTTKKLDVENLRKEEVQMRLATAITSAIEEELSTDTSTEDINGKWEWL